MVAYRERSWLHAAVEVRPSPIAGRGLFATAALTGGTVVAIMGGRLIDDADLARLAARGEPYSCAQVEPGRHLQQADDDRLRYGNHSCDPTLWLVDAVTLVARRDVAPGEELTTDYAASTTDPAWRMTCRCGAASCRGVVTGDDRRLPELRRRYRGHFAPFVV